MIYWKLPRAGGVAKAWQAVAKSTQPTVRALRSGAVLLRMSCRALEAQMFFSS